MQLTHSRAIVVAIVALSTCAGATRIGERDLPPAPAVVASADAPAPDATLVPADSLAALGAGQAARRSQ